MNQQQIEVAQRIGLGILEAVDAGGDVGAPGGVLYAAMMANGASLNQYQSFMGGLVNKGMLVLEDDCYHMTDAGRRFMAILKNKFTVAA